MPLTHAPILTESQADRLGRTFYDIAGESVHDDGVGFEFQCYISNIFLLVDFLIAIVEKKEFGKKNVEGVCQNIFRIFSCV